MSFASWGARIASSAVLLVVLPCAAYAASAPPKHSMDSDQAALWDGISVVAAVGGLDVRRAKTRLQRNGQRFTAALLDDAGEPIHTITGTVRNGKVSARRLVLHSDVGEESLQGTWTSSRIGPYRSQSIVLGNAWAAVVLTHSLIVDPAAFVPPRQAPSRP